MNAIRKILMPFLVIPLGMFIYAFAQPDWPSENSGFESLFAGIGIPILIVNLIAWFYPEIIKAYFPVKDDWGERGGKSVTFAVVISTLIAFACTGAGVASAIANAHSTFEPSPLQPAAATAFARSNELQSKIADSSEVDVEPASGPPAQTEIPTGQASQSSGTDATPGPVFQSPITGITPEPTANVLETTVIPEPSPQIPVSGGTLVSSPTLSATQTGIASTATAATAASTSTPGSTTAGACVHADPNYVAEILQTVQDADSDNVIGTGWAVPSRDATNLWFIAAKISGPNVDNGITLPGVWALYVNSNGSFDVYSINDPAMEYSGADWGEDADPVLTMQNDGAQASYNCAAQAN